MSTLTAPPAPARRRRLSGAKRAWLWGGAIVLAIALVGASAFAGFYHSVVTYRDPWGQKVEDAGYEHKTAQVHGVDFSYVEGPDNGTPLVLLHAQLMDWFDYSRVLPDLAEDFHVFVVDYQGHGQTTTPADYEMSANNIGPDLAELLDQIVGEPAYISGNSSGGLLTLWLAANEPALVEAVVLEDPPLFNSEYPAIKDTVAIKAFRSSHDALVDGYDDDFLMYWLDYNTAFFDRYVFPGSANVISFFVTAFRNANPGELTELSFISDPTVKLLMRGLEQYDPTFGNAFYEGTWNEGFDHADALASVECPVLLLHANWSLTDEGLLDGGMSDDDAGRAMSLLSDGTYERIDSSHVIHLDQPEKFLTAVDDFLLPLDDD